MDNTILKKIKVYYIWAKKLWHPFHKTAYLLMTPTHDNIGDSAIAVAEVAFLKKCGYKKVVDIPICDCWDYYHCIAKLLPSKAVITLHGGGNMGDLYLDEPLRRMLLSEFKKHSTIIFPQTIFYSDTPKGKEEEGRSVQFYNKKNITIAAREQTSYMIMKNLYPEAKIILTPDIVLSMDPLKTNSERHGILICFRDDQERSLSESEETKLVHMLENCGYQISFTSMIFDYLIPMEKREKVVFAKMDEFSRTKLVVTDRLHGMIFAALTQTPCIVFGNNHHKVIGVYEWINHLHYIRFAESVEEACEYADELYQMQDCRFVFDSKAFDALSSLIQSNGH